MIFQIKIILIIEIIPKRKNDHRTSIINHDDDDLLGPFFLDYKNLDNNGEVRHKEIASQASRMSLDSPPYNIPAEGSNDILGSFN